MDGTGLRCIALGAIKLLTFRCTMTIHSHCNTDQICIRDYHVHIPPCWRAIHPSASMALQVFHINIHRRQRAGCRLASPEPDADIRYGAYPHFRHVIFRITTAAQGHASFNTKSPENTRTARSTARYKTYKPYNIRE